MPRIKLIVTGAMEKLALHKSLKRLCPPQRKGEDVSWEHPRQVHGVTNHQLERNGAPSRPMLSLARTMLTEVDIGMTGNPPDLVVIIDDVELGNVGNEDVVAQHFRDAMNQCLDELFEHDRERTRLRALLREKCSFHLLNPMVESYLFGDLNALGVAGVPAGQIPKLVSTDVEQFETNDPVWLPTCREENARKVLQLVPWWRHERHPKKYLDHLTQKEGVFYEETDHGKRALLGLDWAGVPKLPEEAPLIRSLFEDLADWFEVPSRLGAGSTDPRFYRQKSVDRASLLLRNL